MRLFFSFIFLVRLISADVSPLTFNDELRNRIQKFQPTVNTSVIVKQRHLLSMLARYSRIHKHFVQQPSTGYGYRYRFPDPAPDFDEAVAKACSVGSDTDDIVMNCLEYMSNTVIPKTNWANYSIDLLETKLQERITDSAFPEVLTFVGIMCWATRNHLSFLEHIPCADKFYTKDPTEVGMFKWDGALNSFDAFGGLPLHGITTIHEDPFHCAELSFCPSPCTTSKRDGCTFESHLNIDLLGMIENKWNLTFPCGDNQIYRPDLDICVHKDDCMYRKCPANSVCEEGLPTSKCICQLGFAPKRKVDEIVDDDECAPIELRVNNIIWTSPYATDGSVGMRWTTAALLLLIVR